MTRRWHFWLLVFLTAAGLLVIFWPGSVQEPVTTNESDSSFPISNPDRSPIPTIEEAAVMNVTGEQTSSGSLLNQQAVNAWHSGEIQDAMALFEEAIDADPDDPVPHSNYGRLLTLMVAYEQALPLLERAKELSPDDAQTWLDLATIYERAQLFDKSWEARAEAEHLVGTDAITRDEQGRFVVQGNSLW